jgi:BolA family transcriptional regulator, general stress-responsive regulator
VTTVAAELEALLRQAFSPSRLTLRDDGAAHAGHAGAREGGHYAVFIVSGRFAGLKPLERHRLVYAAAAPLLPGRIHALQISALTPEETGGSR